MAAPVRSSNPKQSDAEATLLLAGLAVCMAVGGLAKWAQANPTVLAALDRLTIPVLQVIAAHAPGFDHFMRQAQPFTWYLIEAAIVVLPLFAAVGFWLLLTADTRRLRRAARKQLYLKRENQRLREMTEEMEAREEGKPTAGGKGRPGEAATDAERLKDVFGKQPLEEKDGKKAPFSFWRWLLGIS